MITNKTARLNRIAVKVFQPGNKFARTFVFYAGNGKIYEKSAIDHILEKMCDEVDKAFPGHAFKIVLIGSAQFNIVHQGAECAAA